MKPTKQFKAKAHVKSVTKHRAKAIHDEERVERGRVTCPYCGSPNCKLTLKSFLK